MTGSDAKDRRRACAEQGRQRLEALFTDAAGRQSFFSLPMIRTVFGARGQ
jgi:hypothetical protein